MRRKLIEVALPLEAINVASAREKSIRHGHPSTLHLWWARRPLAACRAVLFASLVDDPSSEPERFPTPKAQEDERTRLFEIIERLVKWESTTDEVVLQEARNEISRSTGGSPPPVLDPFCGGGSIPLEAQRLGLTAYASDLNPLAVLITKALIEIPPRFADRAPVHPDARRGVGGTGAWKGASGLAEDVRQYGAWVRDEAERRIGQFYPKVSLPKERGGGDATVIAWIWARTVTCPNPACAGRMPLVRSFVLSSKKGSEAWVEPIVDRQNKTVRFTVRTGDGSPSVGTVDRQGASCLICGTPVPFDHVRSQGRAGDLGAQLMAVVAEGDRRRVYLAPEVGGEVVARSAQPKDIPTTDLPDKALGFRVQTYGMVKHSDLFTARQLTALTTLCDLVIEARARVLADASAGGVGDAQPTIDHQAYADAIATYLGLAVSRTADRNNTICTWDSGPAGTRASTGGSARTASVRNAFARQALPMTWDFAESNPFSDSGGSIDSALAWLVPALEKLPAGTQSFVFQRDVAEDQSDIPVSMVSTDPPYYDNIGYADLSDFFYVWLRRSLANVYPDLFGTLLTPKAAELIATPHRFGGDRGKAEAHFESGLGVAFDRIRAASNPEYPVTVFYAFKQSESDEGNDGERVVASTGWETMLEGLLRSGFSIVGTWPMRSELSNRMVASGTNALASSIVLVCRPRHVDAGVTTRSDFVAALRRELPAALRTLQHGNIAPVDLAQASIGPGMAIFSRYAKVLEADGSPVKVRSALALINQVLDEVVSEQEGEFDSDTRFAISWFTEYGTAEGPFGRADDLARARNTAVNGLEEAGILHSGGGKVRLFVRAELDPKWDPSTDRRPTVWEATQHLVRRYFDEGSEQSAAELLYRLGGMGGTARDLAYRLYLVCERKGWADEARAYNGLVVAWPEISRQALATRSEGPAQQSLDLGG
jgi:putative DNA methylase